ncbi:hypothetical protein LJC64_02790 [Ruminococcaceae bacterium OttesenSCG-928-A11]|nr:hypothetical protein [Ruminococcaceae bacterium OttesenSCG-928-A11]
MTKGKHAGGKTLLISGVCLALIGFVLVALLGYGGVLFSASADEATADAAHSFSYTQKQLVELVEQAVGGDRKLTAEAFTAPGTFCWAEGEQGMAQQIAALPQAVFLGQELEDDWLLAVKTVDDGCHVFLTIGRESEDSELRLKVAAVNPAGKDHAVAFEMEAVRAMPAEMKAYSWSLAGEEAGRDDSSAAPSSSAADSSLPTSAADSGSSDSSAPADSSASQVDSPASSDAGASSSGGAGSSEGGSASSSESPFPNSDLEGTTTLGTTKRPWQAWSIRLSGMGRAAASTATGEAGEAPPADSSGSTEPPVSQPPADTTPADGGDSSAGQTEPEPPAQPPADPPPAGSGEPIYHMLDRASHSVADCLGATQVLLPANGVGVITIHTGQLYGGQLDAPTTSKARLLGSTLLRQVGLGADQGTPDDKHGILRLYDDKATYSSNDNAVDYTFTADTVININPSQSTYGGGSFTIQLYNNNPITIKKIQAPESTYANSNSDATIQLVGQGDTREITISNNAGDAIYTRINVTVGGTIGGMSARLVTHINGSEYGIRAAKIFFENGENTVSGVLGAAQGESLRARADSNTTLLLSAEGQAEHVVEVSEELVSSGSTLRILGGGSTGSTVNTWNLTCNSRGALLIDGEGSPGAVVTATNSVFANGGGVIRITGANSTSNALYAEAEVLAETGAEIRVTGNGTTPVAIYCNGVTGVDRLLMDSSLGALICAEGAPVAISTQTLYAKGGSGRYGSTLSENDTGKNRIVARGSSTGIEVRASTGGLDVLSGAVVIAHGGQVGMQAASGVPAGTATRTYGTIIATSDAGGPAFAAAPGTASITIADGLRLLADGGTSGVGLGTTTLHVDSKGEVIAKGTEDGIAGTGRLMVDGGFVYAHGMENGIKMNGGIDVSATGGLYAVGGVPFDQLMPATDTNLGKFSEAFDTLPLPPLTDKRVTGQVNTAGIRSGGLVLFDGDQTMGQVFGGEYGATISAGGLTVTNGAELLAHGGDYGVHTTARVSTTLNGLLHGYGNRYGIQADNLSAASDGYTYGYGLTAGIKVVNASGNSFASAAGVVGHTKITRASASGDLAHPAIVVGNGGENTLSVQAGALVHEVYDIDDLLISTPPLYALNRDITAVGRNMGTEPANMAAFTWLTPDEPPTLQPNKRHFMNYAPHTDSGAVSLVQEGTATGLRVERDEPSLFLTANISSGADTACAGGAVTGSGGYRITFNGGVETQNTGNEFKFRKVDAQDITKGVTGATFGLYQCSVTTPGHTHAPLVTDAVVGAGTCWQLVSGGEQNTAADGTVDFGALQNGVYMLVELVTPAGYQSPTGQWQLSVVNGLLTEIIAKGDMLPPAFGKDGDNLILPNMKGFEMPAAGGFGTWPFILGGSALIAAGLLVVLLKKMTNRRRKTVVTIQDREGDA